MSNLTVELDDAAEAEFYKIIEFYKQFDHLLSYDLSKSLMLPFNGQLSSQKQVIHMHHTKRIFLNRFP